MYFHEARRGGGSGASTRGVRGAVARGGSGGQQTFYHRRFSAVSFARKQNHAMKRGIGVQRSLAFDASPSPASPRAPATLQQGPMSPRRFLLVALLVGVIFLSLLASRPSVKRALVNILSPGRRAGRAAKRAARASRSAAVAASSAAVELRSAGLGGGGGGSPSSGTYGSTPAVPYYDDGQPIPDIVHFIFGLEPTFGHIKFGLLHYLAVLGARTRIAPQVIKWHYNYLPEGIWWECTRPALTLHKVEDVTHVHGKPKAMRVQHKADILRMQIMLNEGGMYLVRSPPKGAPQPQLLWRPLILRIFCARPHSPPSPRAHTRAPRRTRTSSRCAPSRSCAGTPW